MLVLDGTPHAPVFSVNFTVPVEASKRVTCDNFQLLEIGQAVHISTQPAATANLATGASGAICSVNAGGTTSATYTWKRNGTAITGSAYAGYYSGYNSPTLSAVSIPASENAVSLTCTVGGTYAQSGGAATVDSTACALTVGTADPCLGVPVVASINSSPLAPAGQVYSDAATITCAGCSASATTVTIKDTSNGNTVIGTATGGASTVAVSVSGLTTGHILCAVQTVGGVESCMNSAPTVTVGNPGCTYVTAVGGIATVDPIAAGDTSVTVTGVSASAQDVTVYANGVQVGQNTSPGGNATVTVTTSPLVKGRYLTATQKLSGTEGCTPGSSGAPIVGGGNAGLRICLEFTVGGTPYLWLGASGRSGSYASSPTGATLVSPSVGWQTLTWTPGTSSAYNWGTASAYTFPTSGSGTLQYIWLVADDNSEMGPYTVYIDNVKNGNTVIEEFESDTLGNSAFMQQPSFATSGRTAIHDNPNDALCVNTIADVGVKCQQMDWEFVNSSPPANGPINQIRGVLKNGVTCDLSKPISFRILFLPAGVSSAALNISQPAAKTLTAGTSDSVGITATVNNFGGSGSLAYQWKKNGTAITAGNAGDLTGYTSAALNFANPVLADVGSYSCAVSYTVTGGARPGTYTSECNQFSVTVNKGTPTITWANPGDITYGTALDGAQLDASASVAGSFAYNPASGTVLGAGSHQALNTTFTPTDTTDYNGATATVYINVNKATPNVIVWPTASAINFRQTLASSALTGGSASVGGAFGWTTPTTAPAVGVSSQSVTFTPSESANYTTVIGSVNVTVNGLVAPTISSNSASGLSLKIAIAPVLAAWGKPPGDTLSLLSVVSPSSGGGTVSKNSTYIFYAPPGGSPASDSIAYTVKDLNNDSTSDGTITINFVKPGATAQEIVYSEGGVRVTFAGIPGVCYDVQRSTSVGFGSCDVMCTTNAPPAGVFTILDATPPQPCGYYRTTQH